MLCKMSQPLRPGPKPFLLAALLLGCWLSLLACAAPKPLPKAEAVVAAVQASQAFSELTPLDEKSAVEYLGLPQGQYSDYAASFDASRYTPEGIIVLTAKEDKDVKPLQGVLQEYLDSVIAEYRDYQPDQVYKAQQARVRVHGRQLALSIGADDAKAQEALTKLWQ